MGTQVAGNSNNQRARIRGLESPQAHRAVLLFGKYVECQLRTRLALGIHWWEHEMGLWLQNSQLVQETVRFQVTQEPERQERSPEPLHSRAGLGTPAAPHTPPQKASAQCSLLEPLFGPLSGLSQPV